MTQLEPTTQAFIDSLAGAPPIYTLSPEAARNVLAGAQKSASVTLAPAQSKDSVVNVGPKGRTNIRIYRPENAKGALPVVIYTHGGGWVLGDRDSRSLFVSRTRPRTLRCRTATCRLSAAFSAASRRFGLDGNTSSLTRKMSSAIIVAARYVIPSLDQTDEVFGTHNPTRPGL
jgi:hypothetical protein